MSEYLNPPYSSSQHHPSIKKEEASTRREQNWYPLAKVKKIIEKLHIFHQLFASNIEKSMCEGTQGEISMIKSRKCSSCTVESE